MSKGLTLNQKSFAVSLEDENDKSLAEIAASDYTVNVTAEAGKDTNFTVSLKKDYLQQPGFYTADHVAIRFSAVLNKYAIELKRIGNNLNQIARKINSKRFFFGKFDSVIEGQRKIYDAILVRGVAVYVLKPLA